MVPLECKDQLVLLESLVSLELKDRRDQLDHRVPLVFQVAEPEINPDYIQTPMLLIHTLQ